MIIDSLIPGFKLLYPSRLTFEGLSCIIFIKEGLSLVGAMKEEMDCGFHIMITTANWI